MLARFYLSLKSLPDNTKLSQHDCVTCERIVVQVIGFSKRIIANRCLSIYLQPSPIDGTEYNCRNIDLFGESPVGQIQYISRGTTETQCVSETNSVFPSKQLPTIQQSSQRAEHPATESWQGWLTRQFGPGHTNRTDLQPFAPKNVGSITTSWLQWQAPLFEQP